MFDKIGRGILVFILTLGVLLGAYLAYFRYFIELQDRTVEICVDLNDIKAIAVYEKKPLKPILEKIRGMEILSIGVFEETLADASANGELYYVKGSGLSHPAFNKIKSVNPSLVYIYAPRDDIRKRVYYHLKTALGKKPIKFIGRDIMEIDAAEEEIRKIGLGISEAQHKFLSKMGFRIIPRVWNDPHYFAGNLPDKISGLKDFDTIIFDGEEILGYPDSLPWLAYSMQQSKIKFGYVEIIKQFGNQALKKLMDKDIVRVHSISKDEIKKVPKEEAIPRFIRAARERKVRLLYIRPYLPPQAGKQPVAYNLDYLQKVKLGLEGAGFRLGKAESVYPLQIKGWQITLLGTAIIVGGLF
ncbi:DUF5693 family protein, partial [Candidatus Margulisiibacteriota bacterium]